MVKPQPDPALQRLDGFPYVHRVQDIMVAPVATATAAATLQELSAQMKVAHERDPENGLDLSMLNMANTAPVFTKKKKKVA
jgi:hypothetical protein